MSAIERIARLTVERSAIYAAASERSLTEAERRRVSEIADLLAEAWQERRQELAQQKANDHELNVVSQLKERTA